MQEKQVQEDLKKISNEKFNEAVEGLTKEEIAAARQKAAKILKEQKKRDNIKAEKDRQEKQRIENKKKAKTKAKRKTQKQSRKRNR